MKAALIGAVSALVVGLVLFGTETYYTDYKNSKSYIVEFERYPVALPIPAEKARLAADQSGTGLILGNYFIIRNAGSEPLVDGRVRVIPQDSAGAGKILDFYELDPPAGDRERSNVSVGDGVGRIEYKVLNPGEKHALAIISDGASEFTISSDIPKLTTVNLGFNPNERPTWSWLDFGMAMLAAISGVMAALGYAEKTRRDKNRNV